MARPAHTLMAAAALMLLAAMAAPGPAQAVANPQAQNATDQPGNISGVWLHDIPGLRSGQSQSPALPKAGPQVYGPGEWRTLEGETLPLQSWAAAIYRQRLKDEAAGKPPASTMAMCLPHGMPGMMLLESYPIQIIQSPGQVTTLHELMHSHRMIFLDANLPEDPDPSYMGHSVGHWEGDTLVVTTVGIRDTTTFANIPHTEALKTVERIRRLDPQTLEILMTMEDPKAYTKPWRLRATAKLLPPPAAPIEFICENQRNGADAEGHSTAAVLSHEAAQAAAAARARRPD